MRFVQNISVGPHSFQAYIQSLAAIFAPLKFGIANAMLG
jgi:hypothetical protein